MGGRRGNGDARSLTSLTALTSGQVAMIDADTKHAGWRVRSGASLSVSFVCDPPLMRDDLPVDTGGAGVGPVPIEEGT